MIRTVDYLIRKIKKEDLQALEWGGEFLHFRRLYQDIYKSYVEGNSLMWVVGRNNHELIGQLFVQLKSRRLELADGHQRAYLYAFRIKPEHRGKGIGTALLRHAENDLLERSFHQVTLNVARKNVYAQGFYEHRGYKIIAPEPGKWFYIDHLGKRCEINEPSWRMGKNI